MAGDVFNHDDRAIDDHPEVQRSQRQKVRRNMTQIQPYRSKQQRKRNRQGNDKRRAGVQKKYEKDDADQNHAFDQVVHNRAQRVVQQIAAIQHRNNLDARRQETVIELFHFLVDGIQGRLLLRAFAHQNDALNDVRFIDNAPVLHVVGPSHVTQPDLRPLSHFADIFYAKSRSCLRLQNRIFNVAGGREKPECSDVHLLKAHFHKAAAGIDVVVRKLLLDLTDAQAIGNELVRIHANLVLADGAAKVGDIDNIRNRLELLEQNEIFQGPQFHEVVPRIGASYRIPVDLADGAPVRADLRLKILAGRKIDLRQSFQNFLAVPIIHGTVVKDHDDVRQSEDGLRPQKSHVGHSGHLRLDRNCDLLLHFFSGPAWPLRNYRNVVVGNIGISLDRQIVK